MDAASAALLEAFGVDSFFDATRSVDVLLANAEEARALTELDGEEAALALARRYRIACVKLGRDGGRRPFEGTTMRASPQPLEPVKTLGAGDAFAAGFLLALSREADPYRRAPSGRRSGYDRDRRGLTRVVGRRCPRVRLTTEAAGQG